MTHADPTRLETSPDSCPSCLAERSGPYCHSCGQRYPEGRLTLRGLWRQLPARVFNLERGLLHTFLELFRRPGVVAREYVAGCRRPYTNPLTYFLVAATIQLIGLTLSEQSLHHHIKQQIEREPAVVERLGSALGDEPADKLVAIYISVLKKGYTYLFLILMSLPFALYLRFLARGLEPAYNLAETAIFSIYTTAHLVLVTGLMVPVLSRIDVGLHAGLSMLTYAVYGGFAARGFYAGRLKPVLVVVLALAVAFLTFVVGLSVVFVIIMFRLG